MSMQPPAGQGRSESFLEAFWRGLKWLIFGVPKPRRRGRWVYSARDDTWRYYLDDMDR